MSSGTAAGTACTANSRYSPSWRMRAAARSSASRSFTVRATLRLLTDTALRS